MKKWLLYLMIPIMLLQSNMTIVICTSFYYNQNYIEKYLCIQRDMANNNCHGQCYLMKKLKDKQENEQKNFKVHFHESNIVVANTIDIPSIAITPMDEITYPRVESHAKQDNYPSSVFRPPIFA